LQYSGITIRRVGDDWVPLLLDNLRDIEPYEVGRSSKTDVRGGHGRCRRGYGVPGDLGATRRGRHLVVVLRPTDVSHDWLIVGAKEMTPEQAAEYDRWEAHRDR